MRPKHVSDTRLSLFPTAPQGATIFSRYVAYHILSGNESVYHTKEKLLGYRRCNGTNVFGSKIRKINDVLPLAAKLDMKALILDATPVCYYGAALPDARRDMWMNSLMSGKARPPNQFANLPGNRRLTKQHMHFCGDCVTEDENAYGIAFWRVTHQLPGIHHCPVHRCALNGLCQNCGKSQASGKAWNPPTASCPHCGGSSFSHTAVSKSDAYDSYLGLCHQVSRNLDVGLAPQLRVSIYARAMAEYDELDRETRIALFIAMLLRQWNCSSMTAIQDILGAPFDLGFVKSAMFGEDTMVNPAGHLAILAAIYSREPRNANLNGDIDRICDLGDMSNAVGIEDSGCCASELLAKAIEIAALHGLPAVIAIKLLDRRSNTYISEHHRVSRVRTQGLRRELEERGLLKADLTIRNDKIDRWRTSTQCRISDARIQILRDKILNAIEHGATTRQQVRSISESAMKLCRKWDSEWLNIILPVTARSVICPDDKRRVYRERICSYISENPYAPRYKVNINVRTSFRWCYTHDRPWLDMIIPARPKKSSFKHQIGNTTTLSVATKSPMKPSVPAPKSIDTDSYTSTFDAVH